MIELKQAMTKRLHIEDLAPGDVATIVAIDRDGVDPVNARQLHEMGFDEGVDIELLHRAPFGGDPMAVRVGNMVVGLRKTLARMIVVEHGVASADVLTADRDRFAPALYFAEAAE